MIFFAFIGLTATFVAAIAIVGIALEVTIEHFQKH